MDEVTQQNAALVEEAAAAAESLEEQAQKLTQAVAIFKLDSAGIQAVSTATAAVDSDNWTGVERRGPNRATNVARLSSFVKKSSVAKAAAQAPLRSRKVVGGSDEWTEF